MLLWLRSYEKLNLSNSPDSSENPFYFFFKNKKIATNSGRNGLEYTEISAPKNLKTAF